MEAPINKIQSRLTAPQRAAIAARGNVLVMAGAGTGKTHTLVERCLDCMIRDGASLDEILIVTFTEAAATEMRRRLRAALDQKLRDEPDNLRCAEQLALFDAAHIGTLHGFCSKLVREHFYELGLDPQFAILDEGEARLRANETLSEELKEHYNGKSELAEAVQKLIQTYGGGRDEKIRALVLRLHHYAQTRPDADGWLAREIERFSAVEPDEWKDWLLMAIHNWRGEWLASLESLRAENVKAAECLEILKKLPENFSRAQAALLLAEIQGASIIWPAGKKGALEKPLENFFADASFLSSLARVKEGRDPLVEDWDWVRDYMKALLKLTQNFSARFSANKRADGVLDFHDLEQFALQLLWNPAADKPAPVAGHWRRKIRFVFVDEYQDINAAQDKIIQALGRDEADANRFLVGDVKQSIYRFRLADPKIFRNYAKAWRDKSGQTISLAENFRSREGLLGFVNSIFALLMQEEIGGVIYGDEAKLKFGSADARADFSVAKNPSPRVELILRFKNGRSEPSDAGDESGADELIDLGEVEKEARMLALRLKQLKAERHEIWDNDEKVFRALEWLDMAVLLRALSGKSEIFWVEFERAGVPLIVERGGFYDSSEIADLLCLLQLFDNPLQDVPAIAVLRSPLVGLSLDELAQIRLAASGHFWFALNHAQNPNSQIQDETRGKVERFLEQFGRWRKLARQASLSRCLEAVLTETHYDDWLKSRPRGAQRHANIGRFLNLAEKFDQFQRQGLFRFLKFMKAQRDAEIEPDVPAIAEENAVRLMSIHQSKGLEFPVVTVADLAKPFNTRDSRSEIIFDEQLGLCPQVKLPQTGRRYSSLPHWLAQRHQRREQAGEELRLFYVATTRARDTLILTGGISEKMWKTFWKKNDAITPQKILTAKSYADWLGLWFAQQGGESAMEGEFPNLRWRIADDAELVDINKAEIKPQNPTLPELGDETMRKLHETLAWRYGFSAATERAAKSSVTALRRQAADELDDEAEQFFPARRILRATLSAAATGTAHHKFLQHVSFESAGDLAALAVEAKRLESAKILSAAECAVLDLQAVAAFWNSKIGRQILERVTNVKRELPFTSKFSPGELSKILGAGNEASLESEFVVVQGVADLAVLLPEEIWLVDFKTDDVHPGDLPEKMKFYAPQLKLYAGALAKIYSRPVTQCWLHFLSLQKTVSVGT